MNITAALVAPFTWLRNLFAPKMLPEVEYAIEQLDWNRSNFALSLENNGDGSVTVVLRSVETIWIFPDDEPQSVAIFMSATNCWLESAGVMLEVSNRDKAALVQAVREWIELND